MLGEALREFLPDNVDITVQYALNDSQRDEVVLTDKNKNISLTLRGNICWDQRNYGNVIRLGDYQGK